MNELPVGRAALGCLAAVTLLLVAVLLVRCGAELLTPVRGDDDLTVASVAEASRGPIFREVVLSDAPPIAGERLENGVRTLTVVVAPVVGGGFSVVNARSTVDACPVELRGDRLVDCNGAAWNIAGEPLDPGLPPLQRFPSRVDLGAVVADFSAPAGRHPGNALGTQPA
jgi:hypothetical protein